MKISVDDKVLFTLSDTQKRVIMNDINEDLFKEDMCRRLQYVLEHKYERCFERLKAEWEPKLASRVDSLPTNKDAFAKLVFSQQEYCSKKVRDDKALEENKDDRS